jgi:hypothetical protein
MGSQVPNPMKGMKMLEVAAALHYRKDEYFNMLIPARNAKTSLSDSLISSSLQPNQVQGPLHVPGSVCCIEHHIPFSFRLKNNTAMMYQGQGNCNSKSNSTTDPMAVY